MEIPAKLNAFRRKPNGTPGMIPITIAFGVVFICNSNRQCSFRLLHVPAVETTAGVTDSNTGNVVYVFNQTLINGYGNSFDGRRSRGSARLC